MKFTMPNGSYVIATSGGVDSMALLHILRQRPGLRLVVAHFDHGIRPDSALDRKLVQQVAAQYRLPFTYDRGHLGAGASEAEAREARYAFLERVRQASGTRAIVMAHHQDDLLETALLNLLRGTNRRGLSSLRSTDTLVRPLLEVPKSHLRAYAVRNGLQWREDSTNADIRYKRNYIRHVLLPRMSEDQRAWLLEQLRQTRERNVVIDNELDELLQLLAKGSVLNRQLYALLPAEVGREVLALWLRQCGIVGYDAKALFRLDEGIRQLTTGKIIEVTQGYRVALGRSDATLTRVM